MRCREIERMLPDYSAGGLSAAEAANVQAHLATCKHCSLQEHRYKLLFTERLRRDAETSQVNWSAFGAALNEKLESKRPRRFHFPQPSLVPVIASLLLITVLGIFHFSRPSDPTADDKTLHSELERVLDPETIVHLPLDNLDDFAGASRFEATTVANSSLLDYIDEAAATALDELLLLALYEDAVLVDNLEYLTETEALGMLSPREAEELYSTMKTTTFLNN